MTSLLSVSLPRSRFLDVTQRSFVQWNTSDTDSEETCHSIRIIRVSEKTGSQKRGHEHVFVREKD